MSNVGPGVLRACSTCGTEYPATSEFFEKNKACVGGITHRCKPCSNKKAARWREENRDVIIERWHERYKGKHGEARQVRDRFYREHQPQRMLAGMMSRATIKRAQERGLPCDDSASVAALEALLIATERCPICDVELRHRCYLERGHGKGKAHDATPTIDRIIPAMGYVQGNVAIICWRCNRLKSDGTLLELERIVQWLKRVAPGASNPSDKRPPPEPSGPRRAQRHCWSKRRAS